MHIIIYLFHLFIKPLATSPNASGIQDWRVKIQFHSPVWRVSPPPPSSHRPFCIFGQLFSDLASENTELFASLFGECLEKLIHTL
jgi:hypothetical protein